MTVHKGPRTTSMVGHSDHQQLIARGKERGYITFDELNAILPPDQNSSEQIEDVMANFSEMGIQVVESEETEEEFTGDVDKKIIGSTDDPVQMYLRENPRGSRANSDIELFVAMTKQAFRPSFRPWVLFRHGTLVGPIPAGEEAVAHATKLMREWGPVRPGSPAGDFNVLQSNDGGWDGWVILSHHPLIVTLVALAEMPNGTQDVAVGLFGRGKRDLDARELDVVHVEPPPD